MFQTYDQYGKGRDSTVKVEFERGNLKLVTLGNERFKLAYTVVQRQ